MVEVGNMTGVAGGGDSLTVTVGVALGVVIAAGVTVATLRRVLAGVEVEVGPEVDVKSVDDVGATVSAGGLKTAVVTLDSGAGPVSTPAARGAAQPASRKTKAKNPRVFVLFVAWWLISRSVLKFNNIIIPRSGQGACTSIPVKRTWSL
jgi:hypothetical protein